MVRELNNLEEFVETSLRHSENRTETRSVILNWISEAERLPDLITYIRDDSRTLRTVARRSYRHPNGFDKVTLLDRRPRYAIRLHIWQPNHTGSAEHIHNHPWDLAGKILLGKYRWRLYSKDDSGELFYRYRFRYEEGKTGHWFTPNDSSRIRCFFDATLSKDSGYSIERTQLHRITNTVDAVCVSLIMHGPVITYETDLFSKVVLPHDSFIPNTVFQPSELREVLRGLLQHIDQG